MYQARYDNGCLYDPRQQRLLAISPESLSAWKLWDSLETPAHRVLDSDGDWLDHAELKPLPDGRALYHDELDGWELLSVDEVELLIEMGAIESGERGHAS